MVVVVVVAGTVVVGAWDVVTGTTVVVVGAGAGAPDGWARATPHADNTMRRTAWVMRRMDTSGEGQRGRSRQVAVCVAPPIVRG